MAAKSVSAKAVSAVQVSTTKTCTLCGAELNNRLKFKIIKHLNGNTNYACSKCTWNGATHWEKTMHSIDTVFTELGKLRGVPMGDVEKLLNIWESIDYSVMEDVATCMSKFEDGEYDERD